MEIEGIVCREDLFNKNFSHICISGDEYTKFITSDSFFSGYFIKSFTAVFYGKITFCMAENIIDLFEIIKIFIN